MKKIINIIDTMSVWSGWLAGILMAIALVLTVAEIVTRTGLGKTLYVADEYSGYLMAMLTFCGLAFTLRERGHIRMMMLPHFVKGPSRVFFDMGCFIVGLVFSIAFTWYTFVFFWDSAISGSRSMQLSETYLAIPQFFMPLGAFLMALQFLAEFLKGVAILRGDTEDLVILEETDELGR